MDNDNKIKDTRVNDSKSHSNANPEKIHQEVILFLGDELNTIHRQTSSQTYDIEREYAKTRKNVSLLPIAILLICFLAVFGIAYVMNRVINAHNEEISVSLQEFDDLNLKGLLDTVSTAQANYDTALKNKIVLQTDMEEKLKAAKEAFDNDKFVIDSMNLKFKKVYNDKIAVARQKYNAEVKAIHNEYDSRISALDKEIAEYKTQLAEFDAAKVQAAREQEKILDSERQLREIEKQKIVDSYEERIAEMNQKTQEMQAKHSEEIRKAVSNVSEQFREEMKTLDPQITDEELNAYIARINGEEGGSFDVTELLGDVSFNSEYVAGSIRDYQKLYDDYEKLDKVVAAVPQKNSIPAFVKAEKNLVNKMGKAFVDTTVSLYEENQELYGQIDSLSKDFDEERKFLKGDIKTQQNYYETTLENVLTQAKTNAILLYAESYERINVYVVPKARYLIKENGTDAEIKASKPIKGKIFRESEDKDNFYFVVGTDKNGKQYEVNFAALEPGTPIKILSK